MAAGPLASVSVANATKLPTGGQLASVVAATPRCQGASRVCPVADSGTANHRTAETVVAVVWRIAKVVSPAIVRGWWVCCRRPPSPGGVPPPTVLERDECDLRAVGWSRPRVARMGCPRECRSGPEARRGGRQLLRSNYDLLVCTTGRGSPLARTCRYCEPRHPGSERPKDANAETWAGRVRGPQSAQIRLARDAQRAATLEIQQSRRVADRG